ncbi:MAG: 6-phosphofructokinase, partial [Myxococcales bacterium]|nr:6-phosphofructokinase [Myxococcales bacterium]
PPAGGWEQHMLQELLDGRDEGRRNPVIVLAEGACDSDGNPITADQVKQVVERGFGGEVRVTVLGHVQRGGAPSAFDRNLGTILGHAAAQALIDDTVGDAPVVIGTRGNRVVHVPLAECLAQNDAVVEAIRAHDYPRAMALRGHGFKEGHAILRTMLQARPSASEPKPRRLRLAVLNAGAPAPGMNAAVRAAVRIGLDKGHEMLGVDNGFQGLIEGHVRPLGWMDVSGWVSRGGSELGARRTKLVGKELYAIARTLENERIDGLLVVGGWTAYVGAHAIYHERGNYPACDIPIVCLPASIDNNLPGSELSIGADTALNSIVWALDRIRLSASAQHRCFVVEVMGRRCGYLAMMSALASGAERAYLHERGVTVGDLLGDVEALKRGFLAGRRLGLVIRNEMANDVYDARFMGALYEEESGDLFDVRVAILGHLQQGGAPTPFDRIHATRLAGECIDHLIAEAGGSEPGTSSFVGLDGGKTRFWDLQDFPRMVDLGNERPRAQWWLALQGVADALGRADRGTDG